MELFGIKDRFFAKDREFIESAKQVFEKTRMWKEVEKFVMERFEKDISFLKPNFFTYMFFFVVLTVLITLYLWKFYFSPGTAGYFASKLFFALGAMFALKGIVGHYVVVFINRDRFNAELKALKNLILGGDCNAEWRN